MKNTEQLEAMLFNLNLKKVYVAFPIYKTIMFSDIGFIKKEESSEETEKMFLFSIFRNNKYKKHDIPFLSFTADDISDIIVDKKRYKYPMIVLEFPERINFTVLNSGDNFDE